MIYDGKPWLLDFLVGGWTNLFEKYARQNGNFPQGSGWKFSNIWNHHLDMDGDLVKGSRVYSDWKLVYVSYICYQFFFEMMWFSFFYEIWI